jgi:Domain of unknown function (DUF932)
MQNAQLVSHVDTDLVSRVELRALPEPQPTHTFKPVAHIELVDMLDRVLQQNQIRIQEERFALRRDGSVLFGVLQLAYGETEDGRAALGLRTANNKTMTIQLCAGLSVFVCDNLAFRGDMIALRRKHTSGLNLRTELAGAVLRFQDHFGRLAGEVERLKARPVAELEAKALIHDAFAAGLMPLRFLPDVSRAYFDPALPEFAPRTAWSLHNAFTGAAKDMPLTTRLPAIQALGKLFGMTAEMDAESPTLDAPPVRMLPPAA